MRHYTQLCTAGMLSVITQGTGCFWLHGFSDKLATSWKRCPIYLSLSISHIIISANVHPWWQKNTNNEANIKGPATKIVLSLAVCPLKGFCEPLLFSCLPSDTWPRQRDRSPGAQQADRIGSRLTQETGQTEVEESLHPAARLVQLPVSVKTSKNKSKTMKDLSDMMGAKIAQFFFFFAHKWIKSSCLIISSSVQLPASGTCQAGVESCSHPQL